MCFSRCSDHNLNISLIGEWTLAICPLAGRLITGCDCQIFHAAALVPLSAPLIGCHPIFNKWLTGACRLYDRCKKACYLSDDIGKVIWQILLINSPAKCCPLNLFFFDEWCLESDDIV